MIMSSNFHTPRILMVRQPLTRKCVNLKKIKNNNNKNDIFIKECAIRCLMIIITHNAMS